MNPKAHLRCRRCGVRQDLGFAPGPCPACPRDGSVGTLEVGYDLDRVDPGALGLGQRGASIWQFGELLPTDGTRFSLGEGNTPLLRSRLVGPALGMDRLFFKNETTNPTWSHKDRFHAVSSAMARELGYACVVASSTGNHGASMAAYAAASGLRGLVLCPPQAPRSLLALIRIYGADVVVTDWDARDGMGRHLVRSRGWYPATGLDPDFAFWPNPFGAEGHKTIAFELVRDLGGVPDSVWVPCAGGDTFSGIWKGFRELRALGLIDRLPRMYGCQPAGADALRRTLEAGGERSVVLDRPESVATSVRERTIGMPAVDAVRESGGGAPTATDEEIVGALRDLGREAVCVEPASAVPVACLRNAVAAGAVGRDERAVCVLTAAGVKWADVLDRVAGEPAAVAPTTEAIDGHLAAVGLA